MNPQFRVKGFWFLLVILGVFGMGFCAERVRYRIGEDKIWLDLPEGLSEGYYRVERMHPGDGGGWRPVARKRGDSDWERVFPEPLVMFTSNGTQILQDPVDGAIVYFRIGRWDATRLSEPAQAARFLTQATFGPKRGEIDQLVAEGLDYEAWIDAQIALPPTLHVGLIERIGPLYDLSDVHRKGMLWFSATLDGDDQLRQRVAWALSQIFVISEYGSKNRSGLEEWVHYYDIFVRNGFGNFRNILQEVTVSAKMGDYLTYKGNRKASGVQLPDENYARELMQLFTIGLWELNPDGTLKLDAQGDPIPTYDNDNIMEHARVFTGFDYEHKRDGMDQTNRIDPMRTVENRHDTEEKVLLDGTTIPAGGDTLTDVGLLLDCLFNHPNTGPFISSKLIQRLVTSNPSPGYIERVAAVFGDNGQGVRGDLGAVIPAILLDEEARDFRLISDDSTGEMREPILRFTHLCRAFGLVSYRADGLYRIQNLEEELMQFPYRSPSVFNFYQPEYQAPGVITERGLASPEFQIVDDTSAVASANVFYTLIYDGLVSPINQSGRNSAGGLIYTDELEIAEDIDALLDHLNVILTRGSLTAENRETIHEALLAQTEGDLMARVRLAVSLMTFTPEFNILL